MPTSSSKKPDPIDIHVGSRFRLARQALHMSQEKLGEALGITFQQVQKYEKGANRVGSSRLMNISATLNRPVEFFFEGVDAAGNTQPVDDLTSFLNSKEGMRLARAFARVKDLEARLGMLRAFEVAVGYTSGIIDENQPTHELAPSTFQQENTPVLGATH